MVTVVAALIAAVAAIFAAAVAFSGFIIAKDLKTTEFRQAWIDAQRDDLSELIAEAQTVSRWSRDRQRDADLNRFDKAAARISLRENPTKGEWELPLRYIKEVRGILVSGSASPERIARPVDDLTGQAQTLLKIEWGRVRAGEDSYRKSRNVISLGGGVAALIVVCLLCAIGYGKGFIVIGTLSGAPAHGAAARYTDRGDTRKAHPVRTARAGTGRVGTGSPERDAPLCRP